jgi:hypothetical protein
LLRPVAVALENAAATGAFQREAWQTQIMAEIKSADEEFKKDMTEET